MTFSDEFETHGFCGPVNLLGLFARRRLVHHIKSKALRPPMDWYKGLAAADPKIRQVGLLPSIVDTVRELIGQDIVLWGANVIRRKPGQAHPWHCDMESYHRGGGFVTVWLGLENVTPQTSPIFVSRSHLNPKPVQQVRSENGIDRSALDDEAALALALRADPACELARPDIGNGQAIFFDGRIWHATHNTQRKRTRLALLLQYCRADMEVRMPVENQHEWPFQMTDRVVPVVAVENVRAA
ncbi:MAG: phytanoyl-CoA dioxygenase family protein [Pseudomonadota bacterium]